MTEKQGGSKGVTPMAEALKGEAGKSRSGICYDNRGEKSVESRKSPKDTVRITSPFLFWYLEH
ncbi:MAG: hypothetical protein Ct9H90mP24_8030 [Methanobacteriota archaeon]|nr:MAG: hypothetical protein Ct9H90mP24_8030 [Euryarchaeota archaeon]